VFFCTQALYCFVYGLGWPLAISWRIGFSLKRVCIFEIFVVARSKSESSPFLKANIARKSFTHC